MRLLSFKIGTVLLVLQVDSVISVGLDKKESDLKNPDSSRIDLRKSLGLEKGGSGNQAVIRCRHKNGVFELKADQVMGLEDIDTSRHLAWPRVLGFLKYYSGVALINGQPYLALNLDAILSGLKK